MADLFGLGKYGGSDSDSEERKDGEDEDVQGAPESSSEDEDSESSLDSVEVRALEREARLKDYGDADGGEGGRRGVLPSALSAFDEVSGPPSFLDPEATRPLASSATHGLGDLAGMGSSTAAAPKEWHGPKGKVPPGKEFDIARLAPLIKGQKRENPDARTSVEGAVIEGKAKRYKEEGAEGGVEYTDLQIAMLGGQVRGKGAAPAAPGPALPPGAKADAAKQRSQAMGVSEFLDKGVGAALMPRKAQDRKDKEKAKRMKGQSAIGSWKTEAEMVLRQQYDS